MSDGTQFALVVLAAVILLFVLGGQLARVTADTPTPVLAQVTVGRGDTLWSIAKAYGDPHQYILTRVHGIMKVNGLKNGVALREGQTLVVPITNRSAKLYYGGQYVSRDIAEH